MNNIFLNNRNLFTEKGYAVVPLNGKRPFTNDWVNFDFSESVSSKYTDKNIGIKTGKPSGIICIDIDATDPILRQKLYNLLPPIFCGKVGNKEKGINYFFQFNNETSEKINGVVELLSTGNQTVVPPSIHPDCNYPYEWVEKSLLDIDKDDLPLLPPDFMAEARRLAPHTTQLNSPGRNNKLAELVSAMRLRGESEYDIVNEVYEYDLKNHSPPLFSDASEGNTGNPITNAWRFVNNITKSLLNKNLLTMQKKVEIKIVDNEPTKQPILDYKKYKLPKLRGMAQIMFDYIYNNAPIPRSQFAVASALATISTLVGNKVQYQGTLPNIYAMILGDSGSGKDFPLRFPIDVLNAAKLTHYIGEGMPSSDTSIIQNLSVQPIRIDVIDEASFLFNSTHSKDSYLKNIANIYQILFTSSGKYYSGKTAFKFKARDNELGRLGECQNPYVNILCGMTLDDFRAYFNDTLMEKGLGGRFLYFIDDEPKANLFRKVTHIPKEVIYYAEKTTIKTGIYESSEVNHISVDTRTDSIIIAAQKELDMRKLKADQTSKIKPLLNRLPQTMIKLALIDACSVQWEIPTRNVCLKADNIHWAMSWILSQIENTSLFIDRNMSSGGNEQILSIFENVIAGAGGKISLTDFSRNNKIKKLGLLSSQKSLYFKTLEDENRIVRSMEGNKSYLTKINN